jgi:hypothetical protein
LDKNQGEKAYEDNKEGIKNAKEEKAKENPTEYREEVIKKIEKRIKEGESLSTDEEIKAELDKLKNSQIEDPAKLVETETEIMIKIHQKEVSQKINKLTQRVSEILKLGKKDQIATIKKELLEFISSRNIYYSPHKKVAQELIQQLENYSDNNDRHNSLTKPKNFS